MPKALAAALLLLCLLRALIHSNFMFSSRFRVFVIFFKDLIPAENGTIPAVINFDTSGQGFAKSAVGVTVERFMDICIAYSNALLESFKTTLKNKTSNQTPYKPF